MARRSHVRSTFYVGALVVLGAFSYGGANWLAAQSSVPADRSQDGAAPVTPEDLKFLEAIRTRVGSVVPPAGLLGSSGVNDLQSAATSARELEGAATLPRDDALAQDLRKLVQPVERRARQAAAQGDWDLAIRLHQIAVLMQAVGGPD